MKLKLKIVLLALATLAAILAAAFATMNARAGEPADTLETAREMFALAETLRGRPDSEDIRAAAAMIAMQACFDLNEAVMDYPTEAGRDAARAAAACLRDMQRLADEPPGTADAIAPWHTGNAPLDGPCGRERADAAEANDALENAMNTVMTVHEKRGERGRAVQREINMRTHVAHGAGNALLDCLARQ